ncbi:hypothetical protein MKW94_030682 [Papaver nudicaule]|uniref:Thaumatin-like protein 1b n=1 Tax=Papaver nudicaule TaxID=74823 RepID=A0AA41SF38_PAPNU|nr:hypothetical protein [Papaver nudicaule]
MHTEAMLSLSVSLRLILILVIISLASKCTSGATFTFINNCDYTVWPGILSNTGSPKLGTTGFQLPKANSVSFQAPAGWSGRFWGRTGCTFDSSGRGSCSTADCGSGQIECNGNGATPPATLAEFTLGIGSQDFYDVSLVDGYNLPMIVEGNGQAGSTCVTTGCVTDLNRQCPTELKVGNGDACKSACEAFRTPEYCCSGEFGTPTTCRPSVYSKIFKSACPRSYSYAYDDATSTFTCTGADYTITFCPSYSNSQKASKETTPVTAPPATVAMTPPFTGSTGDGSNSGFAYGSGDGTGSATNPGYASNTGYGSNTNAGYGSNTDSGYGSNTNSGYGTGTESGTGSSTDSGGGAMLADASWLAGLAVGDSARIFPCALKITSSVVAATSIFVLSSFYL